VISILLARKRSTKDSIYGVFGRDKIQIYLPWQNLITQECASYQSTMPYHFSSSAPAKTTSTVSSTASTSVSATTQRRMTCARSFPAYALVLALERRVGHHGYWSRLVQLFDVSNRLNVIRLASELSVDPVGQTVRLQANWRAICAGNIAFHFSRMSSDLFKLIPA